MSDQEPWTIARLLKWTTEFLTRQGADSPRLDAELLLAAARGCKRIELYTSFDEVPSDAVRGNFRELVRRRGEGMPVAYLLGAREFYSRSFRVTPDVLIPRPETEFVVVALLDLVKAQGRKAAPLTVADVGTGSGILAVIAALELPAARVTAIDLSPAALEVARGNAAAHGVAERVEWREGDLLSTLPAEQQFDFILSNPPYVAAAEMPRLAPSVRDYEPRLALEAGPAGTEVYARLIPQAAQHLLPGGYLILEVGQGQAAPVRSLIADEGSFELLASVKDLAGVDRVVQARRKG